MRRFFLRFLVIMIVAFSLDPVVDAALIRGSIYMPRSRFRGQVGYSMANIKAVGYTANIFQAMGTANTVSEFGLTMEKISIMVAPLLVR